MQYKIDPFRRKLITVLLTKRKHTASRRNQSPEATSKWLLAATFTTLLVFGFLSGWYSGTSETPISSTVIPLLFGIVSVTFLSATHFTWTKTIGALFVAASFVVGLDRGEDLDEPVTAQQLIDLENVGVSNEIFDELLLLDLQLRSLKFEASRHNSVMYSVGLRTAADDKLSRVDQVKFLKQFRESLRQMK